MWAKVQGGRILPSAIWGTLCCCEYQELNRGSLVKAGPTLAFDPEKIKLPSGSEATDMGCSWLWSCWRLVPLWQLLHRLKSGHISQRHRSVIIGLQLQPLHWNIIGWPVCGFTTCQWHHIDLSICTLLLETIYHYVRSQDRTVTSSKHIYDAMNPKLSSQNLLNSISNTHWRLMKISDDTNIPNSMKLITTSHKWLIQIHTHNYVEIIHTLNISKQPYIGGKDLSSSSETNRDPIDRKYSLLNSIHLVRCIVNQL